LQEDCKKSEEVGFDSGMQEIRNTTVKIPQRTFSLFWQQSSRTLFRH
jgi:hypothetical protein